MTVSDAIADLAALVSAGDTAKAKREARALFDGADTHALQIIADCVRIVETRQSPLIILRAYWTAATTEADRALIAACAPKDDHPRRTEPDSTPRQTRDQAARPVRTEVRPELRRRRDQRQNRHEAAVVTAYMAERAGVDDNPEQADRPDGYAIDYDQAAVPALRGTPCVCCWLERSAADQATSRRSDDGMCGDCREKGRPGIPELPAGHTRADAIAARCAFIAGKHHPTTALAILKNEWRRAYPDDGGTITKWVFANRAAIDAPAPTTGLGAAPAPCETCGSSNQVRAGQCADCRPLDTEPATVSASANDAEHSAAA